MSKSKSIAKFSLTIFVSLAVVNSLPAQNQDRAGATISPKATAKDVGLPMYPGANLTRIKTTIPPV